VRDDNGGRRKEAAVTDDPQAMLQEAVKGKSDAEIMEFVGNLGGAESMLDVTFEGMKSALNPDKAQDCIIGYELTDAGNTFPYAVIIKDKQCTYEKRDPSDARVTLGLSVPDYLRLISGELDGMQAFMQGKLKLKGDMMFAQQIQGMFGL
jgi:putative sterol carrier protein